MQRNDVSNITLWSLGILLFYLTSVVITFDVHELTLNASVKAWSDFRAWKEPFSEVYMVKFSPFSKLV